MEHETAGDRVGALESLLADAEGAHGIGDIIGREVTVDEVAAPLSAGWEDLQRADTKPADPWSVATVRRIAEEH